MVNTLRAEAIRLFSTRLWIGAVVAAAMSGGLVMLVAAIGPANVDPPMPGLDTAQGASSVLGLASITLFVPAVFGTLAITSEYRHRTITTTFLFTPRRWKVLLAKLTVFGAASIAYGSILTTTALVGLYGGAAVHGTSVGLTTGEVADFVVRLIAGCCVYTLMGVGIGGLLRHQVLALGTVIGYFYFLEVLLLVIPGVKLAYPFLVGGATSALLGFDYLTQSLADQAGGDVVRLLSPVGGGLVLLGYAVLASVIAVLVPLRRDVH